MKILVTGSSGLIGSEAVAYFDQLGHHVVGIDNNMREDFFGPAGDTTWNRERLNSTTLHFEHRDLDIRDRSQVAHFIKAQRPDAVIHCAAQPSHDLAKDRPFDDFDVNAVGTLNLLEAIRHACPASPFVFMSTNKVYGTAPNEIPLVELPTRWDYEQKSSEAGIDESCRIDQTIHSLFGSSKLAADVLTQEYGRYFEMPTVCFRGGCLTGPNHSGVELHGFLSYLVKVAMGGGTYRIFGYKGKQVRDQIHASDVVRAFEFFISRPSAGAVYNLGGGRPNSVSIMESLAIMKELTGVDVPSVYEETNRVGDHICYISDVRRFKADYPGWEITRDLKSIFSELIAGEEARLVS